MKGQGQTSRTAVVCALASLGLLVAGAAAEAQVINQVTDAKNTIPQIGVMDDAGTRIFTSVAIDPGGSNPNFVIRIYEFDTTTGAASEVISAMTEGVAVLDFPENLNETLPKMLAASDDLSWLVFMSRDDLTGNNPDRSSELFVSTDSGTMITQLSDDPGPDAGNVTALDIDGSGNEVFFFARHDYGSNPNRYGQLFKINRSGSGLTQLTSFTDDGSSVRVSVSDDASRVVFSYDGDPFGTNTDRNDEIFSINGDGTGLAQLTSSSFNSLAPMISGDGTKIAFQSRGDIATVGSNSNPSNWNEAFVMDWGGGNIRQLIQTSTMSCPGGGGEGVTGGPVIVDDASVIVFHSTEKNGPGNIDCSGEIFQINSDGTSLVQLTDTDFSAGEFYPAVSGNGSRYTFQGVGDFGAGVTTNDDGSAEFYTKTGTTVNANVLQLTEGEFGPNHLPDITSDGSTIVFISKLNPLGGGDLDRGGEVYTMDADGSNLFRVSSLGYADRVDSPGISGDGQHVVFTSDSDNPAITLLDSNGTIEAFYATADGMTVRQLTTDTPNGGGVGGSSIQTRNTIITDDNAWIFYDSNNNQAGTNADNSREVYRIDKNGLQLLQLTSTPGGLAAQKPRATSDGSWVVFESNGDLTGGNADGSWEVFRVRNDATGTQQITSGGAGVDSREPDVSGDGSTIVYVSSTNPTGGNADGNQELFKYDVGTTTHTQLTSTTTGATTLPRISDDGLFAYFLTTSEIFETDPDTPLHQGLVDLTTGDIVRIGGVDDGNPTVTNTTADGQIAVFSGIGNFTRENPDQHKEVWLIDRSVANYIQLSGPAPTVVSWLRGAGPLRYDVIRGNVANLGPGAPGTTDLGAVVCLEDDSMDLDTTGDEDVSDPPSGQAFFYAFRGVMGATIGPDHYGESTNGDERKPSSGDCGL